MILKAAFCKNKRKQIIKQDEFILRILYFNEEFFKNNIICWENKKSNQFVKRRVLSPMDR